MSNNNFLPEGYTTPQPAGGDYTKFAKGETLIRILSKPIMFWQDWKDKQPIRTPFVTHIPPPKPVGDQKVKHAWALIVYNYNTKRIEICEITQQTIKVAIENLNKNVKWGNPFAYDISVTRTGDGLETEYSIIANPKEPVTEEIKQAYKDKPINLNALLSGENPFDTPMIATKETIKEVIDENFPPKEGTPETVSNPDSEYPF